MNYDHFKLLNRNILANFVHNKLYIKQLLQHGQYDTQIHNAVV